MTLLKKNLIYILIAAALIVLLVLACTRCAGGSDVPQSDIDAGVAFLESKAAQDPAEMENKLKELRQHDFAEMREERIAQLESGEITCWSLFEDYLICGDSRCISFTYYGLLPETCVYAESGATIRGLEGMVQSIIDANPHSLFLCYGMNDFCAAIWDTPSDWAAEYRETIETIQNALPDTNVYVSAIIPAGETAYERGAFWSAVPNWNEALEEMCGQMDNCTYMDVAYLSDEHPDLYLEDGVHFTEEFYEYLGNAMIMYVFDHDFDGGTDADSSEGSGSADTEAESTDTDSSAEADAADG